MQKRLGTVQNFTSTATSQASAKLGSQTYKVRVSVSAGSTGNTHPGVYILFGDSTGLTVSSSNGSLMPAPWSETFDVTPGQTFYTVAASTTLFGPVSLTELT